MKLRMTTALGAAAVLVAPFAFAFGPLAVTHEDTGSRVNDGKFRAMQQAAESGDPEDILAAQTFASVGNDGLDVPVPTPVECTMGFAGPYTCQNIDLLSVVPLAELGGAAGNDSWGWVEPVTGREIAIMGTGTGTAFIDITDPSSPAVLGQVPSESTDAGILWRDVKVVNDHAFIVSENGGHGIQIFDLARLEGLGADLTRTFEPDAVFEGFGSAHNIVANDDTDYVYGVGTGTCGGGLHFVDVSDPKNPVDAGCFDEDGYTHDAQCTLYHGPDDDYNGTNDPDGEPSEICFAANTDTITIVDVTDKDNPVQLARVGYRTAGYTHQGWLTPDHEWFIFNDELDEQQNKVRNTTTYWMPTDELDLGNSLFGQHVTAFAHETTSTDHNLYTTDGLIWEANYNAGLRVFSYTDEGLEAGEIEQVAFFDMDSEVDYKHYGDAWNVYPYFPSGNVIVSNIAQGLMVLRPDYDAIAAAAQD